jgi:hypothetical protein
VVGTHRHSPPPTSACCRAAAFVSDIPQCGDYESVLGMDPGEAAPAASQIPRGRFRPAMRAGATQAWRWTSTTRPALPGARRMRLGGVWLLPSAVLGSEVRESSLASGKTANSVLPLRS